MKLLFKQRAFAWFDSYDIYDENGAAVYTVEGKLSFGHHLEIYDAMGNEVATLQEKVLTLLPKFEIYLEDTYVGCIRKEFTFLRPRFTLDCNGWYVEGQFLEWDYRILDGSDRLVATITKEILHWTDTYVIDVERPEDALLALMVVLAIDAEKCSRD